MQSDWTTTPEAWHRARRCHKCGRQLFPTHPRSAEDWAVAAYHKWAATGLSPERQRDARAPGLLDQLQRRGHFHSLV